MSERVVVTKLGAKASGAAKASRVKARTTRQEALKAIDVLKGVLWGTGSDLRDIGVKIPNIGATPKDQQKIDGPATPQNITGAQGPVAMRTGPTQKSADGVDSFREFLRSKRAQ